MYNISTVKKWRKLMEGVSSGHIILHQASSFFPCTSTILKKLPMYRPHLRQIECILTDWISSTSSPWAPRSYGVVLHAMQHTKMKSFLYWHLDRKIFVDWARYNSSINRIIIPSEWQNRNMATSLNFTEFGTILTYTDFFSSFSLYYSQLTSSESLSLELPFLSHVQFALSFKCIFIKRNQLKKLHDTKPTKCLAKQQNLLLHGCTFFKVTK